MKVLKITQKTPPAGIRFETVEVKGAGPMMVAADDLGICWMGMTDKVSVLKKKFPKSVLVRDPALKKTGKQILAAWQGKSDALEAPLVLRGTPFQLKVWDALLKIKRGSTLTYQDIAKKIGHPEAVRAVGTAVGSNPITLLVPCHRVLAKSAASQLKFGWGPDAKRKLLHHEGVEV